MAVIQELLHFAYHFHILFPLGLLAAPSELRISYQNESAIEVNWVAPFSLYISNLNQTQLYTVYVRNNESGIDKCFNVSRTMFVLATEDLRFCEIYTFSVSAWNQVGEGDRSDERSTKHLTSNCMRLSKCIDTANVLVHVFFSGCPFSIVCVRLSVASAIEASSPLSRSVSMASKSLPASLGMYLSQ